MSYTKPQVIAKNQPTGTYASRLPGEDTGYGFGGCKDCERAQ